MVKKKGLFAGLVSVQVVSILSLILCLDVITYISIAVVIMLAALGIFANFNQFKFFFSGSAKGKSIKDLFNKKPTERAVTIYDKSGVIDEIDEAVRFLSSRGTGALITIIRKDDILNVETNEPIIKQKGVALDAVVNAELLETIFYLGTRLHDGAVVIRDNKIIAGSVFYESTKRPLTGKYGARHQAAMGISENSDAVTIIVSEENSKISICHDLMMDVVPPDQFKAQLDLVLSQDSVAKIH
ncbi:MAG: diadenylate cyclase [Bacilli bacterium]|nr:diadenylate cyclase [Bacilli bacterium]